MKGIWPVLFVGGGIIAIWGTVRRAKKITDLQPSFAGLDLSNFSFKNPIVNVKVSAYNPNVTDVPPVSATGNLYHKGNRIADIDQKFSKDSAFRSRKTTTMLIPCKLSISGLGMDLIGMFLDYRKGNKLDTILTAKGFINYDVAKNIPFDTAIDMKTGKFKNTGNE